MIFTVYILFSSTHQQIYIGYSSNLIQRFYSHNILATKGSTIRYRPWQVIYCEYFNDKSLAMKREKQLKSGQGRKWIWDKINEQYEALGYIY